MVHLHSMEKSNSTLAESLPAKMVAVFVGATSGIGEYAMKAFAQQTIQPKIYFVGRSQTAADRIIAEATQLNSSGEYIFIKSNVALLKNVEEVCRQIKAKEQSVNLLFQTQGTMSTELTTEGLCYTYALTITSRILFALNLLPVIQRATHLKRVVSIFAAGFEGDFDNDFASDFIVKKPLKSRPHMASMITMANNVLSRLAKDISFVHNYPGFVKTPFGKDAKGFLAVARVLFNLWSDMFVTYTTSTESAALSLFIATSARFSPKTGGCTGAPLLQGMTAANGADGDLASGSYSIDAHGDHVSREKLEHLITARDNGSEERMWLHVINEIESITGRRHSSDIL
ncbi:NAD(P)-binding Rossmann-fold containing protein [Glarea lozoyensis ATCC 20868]|uniref:NAD(P)-binding Rossmann-fold containing protein n=1 Tax=Glarea lozoyensis (strain ATCC 20868 / MF5171) TaxID=1116229 RepID=S3DUE3_GLAL2|nr:NAD(P)-binding Rossmann-fold containing protein [Glarea lozoyensis ATCC 20868]EPE30048.1 NAD(P)-binding Rossmann-fold containing protein [Glarea lozoyensis ATCC 20868]